MLIKRETFGLSIHEDSFAINGDSESERISTKDIVQIYGGYLESQADFEEREEK